MSHDAGVISVYVAADLWGQKVNFVVPLSPRNCPTWESFVDGIECLMYMELIKRRPVVQLMGGTRSAPPPADDEAEYRGRRRLHVCDVHTFVAEVVHLLVHVVGKPPVWEQATSISQLYDRCQLFIFQPEGELTSDDSVALLPEPVSRYREAHRMMQKATEAKRLDESRNRTRQTQPKWWVAAGKRSSLDTSSPISQSGAGSPSQHSSRIVPYKPVALPSSKTSRIPPFATIKEAATACYLGLLRCQLRSLGVSHVLLRQVVADLVMGMEWTMDTTSNGTSPRRTGLGRVALPDMVLRQVLGESDATSQDVDMNTWEYVAAQYSKAGEGAVDMVMAALQALANAGNRAPSVEPTSPSSRHKQCRACDEIGGSPSTRTSVQRGRKPANQSVTLEEWWAICEEAPAILMFLTERLMAVSVAACPFFEDAHLAFVQMQREIDFESPSRSLMDNSNRNSNDVSSSNPADPYHQQVVAQRLMLGLSSVRTRLDRSWEEVHQCASPRED